MKEVGVSLCYNNGPEISNWDVKAECLEDVYEDIRKSVGPDMAPTEKYPHVMYGYGDLLAFITPVDFDK